MILAASSLIETSSRFPISPCSLSVGSWRFVPDWRPIIESSFARAESVAQLHNYGSESRLLIHSRPSCDDVAMARRLAVHACYFFSQGNAARSAVNVRTLSGWCNSSGCSRRYLTTIRAAWPLVMLLGAQNRAAPFSWYS
jgi:hypothetical protein